MDYVVWGAKSEGNSCLLDPIEGVDRDWELLKGVPRAHDFPAGAVMRMSDLHKRDIGVPDNVMNQAALVVVSERLRRFLEEKKLPNVEYLPIKIMNHKRRVASETHVLVHAVEPVDCLDVAQSQPEYSGIIPTDITEVEDLVLDPSKIDPKVPLFRVKDFGYPTIVARSLAEEIKKAGFTGLYFSELDRYGK
jgi:hypothetical protein